MTPRCKFVHNLPCEQVSERITELENENAKLRKLLSSALIVVGFKGRQYLDTYLTEEEGTTLWQELKGLGIETDAWIRSS